MKLDKVKYTKEEKPYLEYRNGIYLKKCYGKIIKCQKCNES